MLFNSYAFILLFLPLTVAGFHLLRRQARNSAAFVFLALASLGFYAWWSVKGVALLIVLMAINYFLANWLIRLAAAGRRERRIVLAGSIAFNLAVLGYFKYANFFIANLSALTGLEFGLTHVALPLGISFFTFQKIALLVDSAAGKVRDLDPVSYSLFVSFFPQLIAGPIVHHSDVIPQFRARPPVTAELMAQALAIFAIGLGKKVLLADNLATLASPVFDAAARGQAPDLGQAWLGALGYTFQLYFDFSGYSDMAIGAALMFGVRLPLNFASPYKSRNIIEFWRRWHMTLSRFLRDYLYIPLGGNRKGPTRRFVNLFLTMLLGGLWHGAGWTFVAWGALHGTYLIANHAWQSLASRAGLVIAAWPGRFLTFLAVILGWVFFRSSDFPAALRVLGGMAEVNRATPIVAPEAQQFAVLAVLLALVWLAPNTQELTGYAVPGDASGSRGIALVGRVPAPLRAAATGLVFACAFLSLSRVSEFIYYQF